MASSSFYFAGTRYLVLARRAGVEVPEGFRCVSEGEVRFLSRQVDHHLLRVLTNERSRWTDALDPMGPWAVYRGPNPEGTNMRDVIDIIDLVPDSLDPVDPIPRYWVEATFAAEAGGKVGSLTVEVELPDGRVETRQVGVSTPMSFRDLQAEGDVIIRFVV